MISIIAKVKPGASKDEIIIDEENTWLIKIKEAAIDGAANTYLINFLAATFNTAKSNIIIEKGLRSRFKKIGFKMNEQEFKNVASGFEN